MKISIYMLAISLLLLSCKDNSNPIKTDPPNPYAQKEIDWPSLQKAPWPMYRHDPQLTGRSQFVGPLKGVIADTIKFHYLASGVSVDKNGNMYAVYEFDTAANYISYNINLKKDNWRIKLPGITSDNPNIPTILSDENTIVASKGLYSVAENGGIHWQISPPSGGFGVTAFNSAVGKDGNSYIIDQNTKKLYCISQQGTTLWTFSDPRIAYAYYSLTISPDGKILYLPCYSQTSLLALDIATRQVSWSFGTLPLYSPIVCDNLGNLYFQKKSTAATSDTFYCLKSDGTVRWEYIYSKGSSVVFDYYSVEPMTIDREGNIYLLAPRDTLVSLTNDGILRWKLPLNTYNGSAYQLVCDAEGTVYFATISNHLLAVSNSGVIRWALKLPYDEWYNSPSITDGKLILTGFKGNVYIIE